MIDIKVCEEEYADLLFHKDDVILDIGACRGGFAKRYYKDVKKVICFEPVLKNFSTLTENIKICSNVIAFPVGVIGNDDEHRIINLDPNNFGAHTMYKEKGERISVRCLNINDLIKQYKPNKLKMDCEGAEYEIIKGINDWSNIKGLIMEWHAFIHDQARYEEIIKLLEINGFKVKGCKKPVSQVIVVAHATK